MKPTSGDDVVVTGVGLCCHMGDDLEAITAQLRAGRAPAFARWQPAVDAGCRCQLLGLYTGDLSAKSLELDRTHARFTGRAALMAYRAARDALAQSGVEDNAMAIVFGSGTGDVATHVDIHERLVRTGDGKRTPPTVIPKLMASTVSANLSTILGTTGPSLSVTAACAGGAYNILVAAQLIGSGHVDSALVGGVEVADIHFHAGFDAMRAYNGTDNDHPERASRPYAADRAGFIFAEGSGALVLERRAGAEQRGVEALGVLVGFGMSSDGDGDMVAPSPFGAEAAMRRALAHAEVTADEIDYVNTHATSTPRGDLSEVEAMRKVFSPRRVAYSSTKGYTGHTVSGAGAIEAIFTLSMLRGGWIAPAVNADPLDPGLADDPPVLTPTDADLRLALSNSLGFGGTNTCLVFAKA